MSWSQESHRDVVVAALKTLWYTCWQATIPASRNLSNLHRLTLIPRHCGCMIMTVTSESVHRRGEGLRHPVSLEKPRYALMTSLELRAGDTVPHATYGGRYSAYKHTVRATPLGLTPFGLLHAVQTETQAAQHLHSTTSLTASHTVATVNDKSTPQNGRSEKQGRSGQSDSRLGTSRRWLSKHLRN